MYEKLIACVADIIFLTTKQSNSHLQIFHRFASLLRLWMIRSEISLGKGNFQLLFLLRCHVGGFRRVEKLREYIGRLHRLSWAYWWLFKRARLIVGFFESTENRRRSLTLRYHWSVGLEGAHLLLVSFGETKLEIEHTRESTVLGKVVIFTVWGARGSCTVDIEWSSRHEWLRWAPAAPWANCDILERSQEVNIEAKVAILSRRLDKFTSQLRNEIIS